MDIEILISFIKRHRNISLALSEMNLSKEQKMFHIQEADNYQKVLDALKELKQRKENKKNG